MNDKIYNMKKFEINLCWEKKKWKNINKMLKTPHRN